MGGQSEQGRHTVNVPNKPYVVGQHRAFGCGTFTGWPHRDPGNFDISRAPL